MATKLQKQRHGYYIKKRAKILKRMRAYYRANKSERKAYQKKYYRKTKKGPMYLRGKGKGRRPVFPRVSAHNRRNGRFAKGVKGATKGRRPATNGLAFKKRTTKRKAA